MLKGIGILCILLGSSGLGITMAGELDQRTRELQTLRSLILLLKEEIRCVHKPLPSAFEHLADRAPEPFDSFFRQTAADLQQRKGRTVRQIWEQNLAGCLPKLHLCSREKRELAELGAMLGCPDVKMQLNGLDYYLEQLCQAEKESSVRSENCRKLYRYMGILGGAVLVVFIL